MDVKQSHLGWTIVRPGASVDGNGPGECRHGFPSTAKMTKLEISRADVAGFMLKQLTEDFYLYKTSAMSY
jgi:hypothetical protein